MRGLYSGLDIKHLVYMPIGHKVLKIDVPRKNFHMPSQYLCKPCKAYVYCWENNDMPWLKNHLPIRARNHKSLCALGHELHAPGMRARLNVKPWYCIKMSKWIPMNIFLWHIFSGNEIVDHVVWKRHCAITKKNGFEFRVISTIYYGLSNEICIYSSFVTIDYVIFLGKKKNNFPSLSAVLVRCAIVLLLAKTAEWPGWSTQISRHRSSDWDNISLSCRLNSLNKHKRWSEWQDKVSFCLLIRFNWRVPARVPLFLLGL